MMPADERDPADSVHDEPGATPETPSSAASSSPPKPAPFGGRKILQPQPYGTQPSKYRLGTAEDLERLGLSTSGEWVISPASRLPSEPSPEE